jgi:hypothetical protein
LPQLSLDRSLDAFAIKAVPGNVWREIFDYDLNRPESL